ncbi:MAG: ATP-dependent Clp protease proteolytic subunit [Clostridiales bacterium]|jgi:ATP-dependent Clp protease protease subunit|nr:ATP-dependent Clp protease proteolytic subunit [Clostridiales bacterium]
MPEEVSGQEKVPEKLAEKLLKTRTVLICGEVNQELAQRVTMELLLLQEMSDDPIKVFINSQGGHVEAGDTIHDMLKYVKPKILAIGTGWVASAGITIYLAADKENRYSLPNTRFMIHQPAGGVQGQASDIKIEADEILRTRARINKLIADATGQPIERVNQDTLRNFWMGPQQAIEYGIVGRIVTQSTEL